MSAGDDGPARDRSGRDAERGSPKVWPSTFPHAKIDELLARLREAPSSTPEEAVEVLQLVAREAQRLRTTVTRISMSRLDEAEQEAWEIVSQAYAHAEEVRSLALRAVEDRLDESERLVSAMRRSFLVEHTIAGNTVERPRWRPARAEDTADPDDPGAEG